MREEIYGGLKNALERGDSIDKAVQSFISAGYNPEEVKAAAESLTFGASTIVSSPSSSPTSNVRPSILPTSRSENEKSIPSKPLPVTSNPSSNNSYKPNNTLPVSKTNNLLENKPVNSSNSLTLTNNALKEEVFIKPEIKKEENKSASLFDKEKSFIPSQSSNQNQYSKYPNYERDHASLGKVLILLIPILLILVGGIILMLIFKENIITFLRGLL